MRNRHITGLMVLLLVICSCSHEKSVEPGQNGGVTSNEYGEIRFDKTDHDLGTIVQGETVGYNFAFSNIGEGSLVILNASASCGCTVPQFSKEPVPPGGSGMVEVVFDSSGRMGQQSKTITIKTNGTPPVVNLTIRADIVEANAYN
jgi:hypothetical protein